MHSPDLRPRHASELVDAAFQLYRRHFADLVTLSALSFAPYILVELLVTGAQPIQPTTASPSVIALALTGWVFGSLMEAATVLAVSNSYLKGAPDVTGTLRATLRRLGVILLAASVKWFLIAMGFITGIVVGGFASALAIIIAGTAGAGGPLMVGFFLVSALLIGVPLGLHLFVRYFAVPATIVLEGTGVRAGLRRSRDLAKGGKARILGALGLPMLLLIVLPLILTGTLALFSLPALVTFLVEQIVTIVAYPLIAVIATLLYYDARIRKEGFDIEIMARELGESDLMPSPSPPVLPT